MQTASRQHPNALGQQSRKIAVIAILLFAFSGLISGFAVGAFVRPKFSTGTTSHTGSGITPVVQITKSTSSNTQPHPVEFSYPRIDYFDNVEKADGNTFYTFSAHLSNVVNNNGLPVRATDLTCKLWLIQRIPDQTILELDSNVLKDTNAIQNPLTGTANGHTFPEVPGLNFGSSAPQIHSCTTYDQATWKYQLSTSVLPGDYDLVALFDWQGIHYNWSWANIQIKKGV